MFYNLKIAANHAIFYSCDFWEYLVHKSQTKLPGKVLPKQQRALVNYTELSCKYTTDVPVYVQNNLNFEQILTLAIDAMNVKKNIKSLTLNLFYYKILFPYETTID